LFCKPITRCRHEYVNVAEREEKRRGRKWRREVAAASIYTECQQTETANVRAWRHLHQERPRAHEKKGYPLQSSQAHTQTRTQPSGCACRCTFRVLIELFLLRFTIQTGLCAEICGPLFFFLKLRAGRAHSIVHCRTHPAYKKRAFPTFFFSTSLHRSCWSGTNLFVFFFFDSVVRFPLRWEVKWYCISRRHCKEQEKVKAPQKQHTKINRLRRHARKQIRTTAKKTLHINKTSCNRNNRSNENSEANNRNLYLYRKN
jgi:hypothetical protein